MTEFQVTSWRDLPSLVVARATDPGGAGGGSASGGSPGGGGEGVVKIALAARFQEAIDEAAMRLGETDADAYLMGWTRSPWTPAEGEPAEVAARVAADAEARWSESALAAYLDGLNPTTD